MNQNSITSSQENFRLIGQQARDASSYMARAETKQKNAVLLNLCQLLKVHREELRQANDIDLANGKKFGLSDAFLDRLRISDTVFDEKQNGSLCMITLEDDSKIELITGPVVAGRVKKRQFLYHTCYETEDLNNTHSLLT